MEPDKIYEGRSTIRMYNVDCMDLMEGKFENHWDLAIVDPPYGIGGDKQIDFGTTTRVDHKEKDWDKDIPQGKFFDRLLYRSRNQIIWGGNYFIDHLYGSKCMIVWDKMNGGNNMADCEIAWSSFDKPVRMISRHIFSGIGNTNYNTIHPTQKPIYLYRWLLNNYAEEDDTILDTHGGSMSLAIACWEGGFDLDICELDEDYFNDAVQRFENHIAQTQLF